MERTLFFIYLSNCDIQRALETLEVRTLEEWQQRLFQPGREVLSSKVLVKEFDLSRSLRLKKVVVCVATS